VSGARARVFFALWPEDEVRAALAQAGVHAQAECGGRATASDKIHLTLFFVGDIERSRVAALEACASRVAADPFELDMSTLGYWRHNRIVWAGARHCPGELATLVDNLSLNLAGEGIRGEDRAYVPHVTLVRNARRAPVRSALEAPVWKARELVLVESVRAAGVVRYEIVGGWPLGRSV
jgi:2'-5' RNA ligase